jgi:hypothetical protein
VSLQVALQGTIVVAVRANIVTRLLGKLVARDAPRRNVAQASRGRSEISASLSLGLAGMSLIVTALVKSWMMFTTTCALISWKLTMLTALMMMRATLAGPELESVVVCVFFFVFSCLPHTRGECEKRRLRAHPVSFLLAGPGPLVQKPFPVDIIHFFTS